jgi:glycerophosphoryl diester phosphodiesterase
MGAMPTRVPSLLDPPIGFAQGGARAYEQPQTREAFALAVKLGATGIAADAWTTADGEVVLHATGSCRVGLRKRAIGDLARASLPEDVVTLAELYETAGSTLHLSIDVHGSDVARRVTDVARQAGGDALGHLWLCSVDRGEATSWKPLAEGIRVVESTRFRSIEKAGPEKQAALMAKGGIDAVRMPYDDWRSGRSTLLHRFGVLALGSAATHRRQLDELLLLGIDGVYSDQVDRMVDALSAVT